MGTHEHAKKRKTQTQVVKTKKQISENLKNWKEMEEKILCLGQYAELKVGQYFSSTSGKY